MDITHIREKYKDRLLQIAFIASGWSPEVEGKRHGAVIALDGKYICAVGFNGLDRNDSANPVIVHAEINSLINARLISADLSRCVMAITKKPCLECFRAIRRSKICAIFWLQDLSSKDAMWVRGENGYGE